MLSFKDITFLEKNKKARDTQGLFVAEGGKLFSEAPPDRIVQVLMTRKYAAEHPEVFDRIPEGCGVSADIEESRFFSLSDTKTPQGIITVLRKMDWHFPDFSGEICPLYAILEHVQDPGNAGTILRTGEAAGVNAVFLTEGSVDMYAPKTIRSTMGSIFRVPHFTVPSGTELVRDMVQHGVGVYAAHLGGRAAYTDLDLRRGSAFVIGNESRGVSSELSAECSTLIRIPMMGRVESLNAAMAAGILMFEAQRQRRAL
ncbi:MAG: RNA methyltransferase [Lachnospiraceae bacterium]|nr:RNA methyltransferase [Lachnospiraceae bacterium]